jgi:hypothetical protein
VRALRKLILGETWALPLGIACAVGASAVVRALAGPHGWWRHGGGYVLAGLLAIAFAVAVLRR